jgi:hypothetical protein
MLRLPLTRLVIPLVIGVAVAALFSVCSASAASDEATNTAAVAAPADNSTDDLMGCMVSRTLTRITVGRNHRVTLVLDIGRKWECGCKQSLCDWNLSIYRRDPRDGNIQGNTADDIEQEDCPALLDYVKLLPAPRLTNPQWWAKPVNGIAVGPFFIEDPAALLRLRTEHDRRVTEEWLRRTLAAVRTCWNLPDLGDRPHPLADRFYAAVGL